LKLWRQQKRLANLMQAVRPHGKIILKSRNYDPISLTLNSAIKKEPVFHLVNYGSFQEAVGLLQANRIDLKDLVDDLYCLENFEQVFEKAKQNESRKLFFSFSR
jgi:threonine dehydrogenase-like Zn-dependent dehydrogenase